MRPQHLLRRALEEKVGKPLVGALDLLAIVQMLGGPFDTAEPIKKALRREVIKSANLGIKLKHYSRGESASWYDEQVAWNYLQELQRSGKISLEGYESMADVVQDLERRTLSLTDHIADATELYKSRPSYLNGKRFSK